MKIIMKLFFKILFTLYILNCSNSFGQSFIKINGVVYKDTLLTETISGVRITILDEFGNKIYHTKTSKLGTFTFKVKNSKSINSIVIGEKKYHQIIISPVYINDEKKDILIKVVLKEVGSIHDSAYTGKSKLISIE